MGLKHGVDSFEHTGLATEPGYPEDILAGLRKRNASALLVSHDRAALPGRLHRPRLSRSARRSALAGATSRRRSRTTSAARSERHRARLLHADLPPHPDARRQVPAAPRDRRHAAGRHGQRHSRQLPHRLDLARARHLGAARHDADAGDRGGHALAGPLPASRRRTSARWRPAAGRRDRGARRRAERTSTLLQRVDVVVKGGVRVR